MSSCSLTCFSITCVGCCLDPCNIASYCLLLLALVAAPSHCITLRHALYTFPVWPHTGGHDLANDTAFQRIDKILASSSSDNEHAIIHPLTRDFTSAPTFTTHGIYMCKALQRHIHSTHLMYIKWEPLHIMQIMQNIQKWSRWLTIHAATPVHTAST